MGKAANRAQNYGSFLDSRSHRYLCRDSGLLLAVLANAAAEWPDAVPAGGVGKAACPIRVRRSGGTRRLAARQVGPDMSGLSNIAGQLTPFPVPHWDFATPIDRTYCSQLAGGTDAQSRAEHLLLPGQSRERRSRFVERVVYEGSQEHHNQGAIENGASGRVGKRFADARVAAKAHH